MSKSKATVSLDPHIWDQFKNETDSASKKIEDLMKTWLNTQGNEPVELKERKEELEEEKQELEEQLARIEKRIDAIEGELETVNSALEKHEKENKRVEKAVESLASEVDAVREKQIEKEVSSLATTKKYHKWLEKIDADSDELKSRIISEVKA